MSFVSAGGWLGGTAKLGLWGSKRHGFKPWLYHRAAMEPWESEALPQGLSVTGYETGTGAVAGPLQGSNDVTQGSAVSGRKGPSSGPVKADPAREPQQGQHLIRTTPITLQTGKSHEC